MVNFKAGDVVVCMDNTRYTSQVKLGVPKVVHSVSPCGMYLRVFRDDNQNIGGYYAEDFILFQEEQDDPLPPAPKSVMYFNSIRDVGNDQCITVEPDNDPYYAGTLCISVHPRGDYAGYQSVSLDPDAALQLAHDLRRMAMEIKRKGKQNG